MAQNRISTGDLYKINQAMAKAGTDAVKTRKEQDELRKKAEEERKKAALEQSKIPNNGGSTWAQYRAAREAGEVKNAQDFITQRDNRNAAWNKVGIDTLEDDMNALSQSISTAYGDTLDTSKYYTQEQLNESSNQVKQIRDRLNALSEYYNTYGGTDEQKKAVSDQIKAYDNEIKFFGDLADYYGSYKNEADFNYRTDKRLDENYIVNDYDIEAGKANLDELKNYLDRVSAPDEELLELAKKKSKLPSYTQPSDEMIWNEFVQDNMLSQKPIAIPEYNRTAVNEIKERYGLDGMTDDEVINWLNQEYQLEEFAQNNAERMRTVADYRSLANNDDYLKGVELGQAVTNPSYQDYIDYENATTRIAQEYFNNRTASDSLNLPAELLPENAPSIVNKVRFYEDFMNGEYGNNTDPTAQWHSDLTSARKNALGYNYDMMTDDEKNVYYYLLGTKGTDAANKYLEDMQVTLDYRNTERVKQAIENFKKNETFGNIAAAALNPSKFFAHAVGLIPDEDYEKLKDGAVDVIYSAVSVPMNVIGGGVATVGDIMQRLDLISKGDWEGKGYNPYANYNLLAVSGQHARGLVAKDIEENTSWEMLGQNVCSQLYQSLMSGADSVFGMATLGKLYTVSMYGSAATSKAAELYESGASNSQIFYESMLSGIAEMTFEYLSLENLSSIKNIMEASPTTLKKAVKMMLVQNGVEASEEVFTEIANTVIDEGIRKYASDYNQKVAEYVRDGMSREEAVKKASGEVVSNITWAGIGGAFSGLASSSLTIMGSYSANKEMRNRQYSAIDSGTADGLVTNAKNIDLSILNDVSAAIKSGDTVRAQEIISEGKDWYEGLKAYGKEKYGKNQGAEISSSVDASVDNLNKIAKLVSEGKIEASTIDEILANAKSSTEARDVFSENAEKLYSLLAKGEASNSEIEKNILKDKGTLAAFERLTGTKVDGTTVSQKRASVRNTLNALKNTSETLRTAQSAIESGSTASEGRLNAVKILNDALSANKAENSRLRNSEAVKSKETKAAIDLNIREHNLLVSAMNYVRNGGDLSGFVKSSVENVSAETSKRSSEGTNAQGGENKRTTADGSVYGNDTVSSDEINEYSYMPAEAAAARIGKKLNEIDSEISSIEGSASMTESEKAEAIADLNTQKNELHAAANTVDDLRRMASIAHGEDIDRIVKELKKPLKKLGMNIVTEDSIEAAEGYRSGAYYDSDTKTLHISRDGWGNVNNVVRTVLLEDGSIAVMNLPISFDRAVTQTVAHEIAHGDPALVNDFIKAVAGTEYDAFDLKGRLEHPNDRSWESSDEQKENNWRQYLDAYVAQEAEQLSDKLTKEQRLAAAEEKVNDAYIFEEIMADMFGATMDAVDTRAAAGDNIFTVINRTKPNVVKRILNALKRFVARLKGKDSYLAEAQRQQADRLRRVLSDTLSRGYGVSLNGESAKINGESAKLNGESESLNSDGEKGNRYSVAGEKLLSFYDSVSNMKDKQSISKRKADLGEISEAHQKLLERTLESEINKKTDLSGYTLWIDGSGAQHIEERHGKDGSSDQSMAKAEDIKLIPWAANNATSATVVRNSDGSIDTDAVFKNSDGSPAPKIKTSTPIGNDTFYVVESVPDSASKRIYIKSAYKKRSNSDQVLNMKSDDSPQPTPEASHGYTASSADSISQKLGDVKKKFSLSSTVEQTQDLIAVHNMTTSELEKTLDLGGFPMPSIAIIKAEDGHAKYGDVSVVFGKDTIDPQKSSRNKVYGGDAWTPVYPKIEYKANEKVEKRIRDKYYELSRKYGYNSTRALYDYAQDLSSVLTSEGGEKAMLDEIYSDTGMMQIYLEDSGKGRVANVNKETVTTLTDEQVRQYDILIDTLGRDEMNEFAKRDGEAMSDAVKRRKEFLSRNEDAIREAFAKTFVEDGMNAKDAAEVSAELAMSDLRKYVLGTYNYMKNGRETVKTEFDPVATNEAIKKAADGKEYREWVDKLFGGAEEKSGIRNGKDAYTASGNRRSFEALHWENNLENVVKAMLEQDETGGAFFSGTGIFGVSTKKYGSISEIKQDSARLRTVNEADYSAMKEQFGQRMTEIAQTIVNPKADNYLLAMDEAYGQIVDAVRTGKNADGIFNYLRKYNSRATAKTASDIAALVRDISEMPTGYFEAKPQRAVGLDEVKAVILPDSASDALVSRLEGDGINTITYAAGDENARLEALNGIKNVRFSLVGETSDGIEVYETSEEVLKMPWKERKKKYLSYIENEYIGRTAKFERNGHSYYAEFDRDNASKAIYGDKRSSLPGKDALVNTGADGSVFELIENSEYSSSSLDRKNHSDTDYFDYFIKTVQIDGKVFDLIADVKKQYGKNGGYIYSLALRENKKIKASPIQGGQAPLTNSGNALIVDNSVPQNTSVVNSNYMQTEKNISENRKFSLAQADTEYLKAVEDGDTETAQRLVDEAAEANGYDRLFWHGAKKGGGFTEFRDWSYFTESKKYAERYAKRGDGKSLYEVYAKLGNVFDTRDEACRELFEEMRSEYGLGELQENGLPDWTDGYDIADFIDGNGLDYDSIILDEGGDLVNGEPVSRGLSYVIRSSEQIKSADTVTYDNDGNVIPLSERFDSGKKDIRWSISRIVGEDGTDYGNGVVLDSTLLENLTDSERKEMVKEYVKELGGQTFTAFDENGDETEITIVPDKRWFKNKNGKRVPANSDLAKKYSNSTIKQEAITLIDELIETSGKDGSAPAKYPHDWLDNNGKNDWEYWTTYIQDKNNTVWKARLNVAVSQNGERILYDIDPIKKVGQRVKSRTIPTDNSISQNGQNVNSQESENISVDERHSVVKDEQKSVKTLINEKAKLKQKIADLRQELHLTHGRKLSRDALLSNIAKLAYNYGSKITPDALYEDVTELYDRMYNSKVNGKRVERVETQLIIDQMDGIVDAIIENATERNTDYDEYRGLLTQLREAKLIVPLDNRANAASTAGYDSWAAFRKANFGRVGFVNEGTDGGIAVDTVYQELSETFPELFPDSITHPGEQAAQIADVARTIRNEGIVENPLYDIEDQRLRRDIASNIVDMIGSTEKLVTFADKAAQKEKDARLRESEKIAELKRQQAERVKRIREHYAESKAARSEKQKVSVETKKILRKVNEFKTELARPTTNRHITEAFKMPLTEFLTSIDIVSKKYTAAQEKAVKAGAEVLHDVYGSRNKTFDELERVLLKAKNDIEQSLPTGGDELADTEMSIQEKQLIARSGVLEDMLAWSEKNEGRPISEMSSAELHELNTILNKANKLTSEIKKLYNPTSGLMARSRDIQNEINLNVAKERSQRMSAPGAKVRGGVESVFYGHADAASFYNSIGSAEFTKQYEGFRGGQDKFGRNIAELTALMSDAVGESGISEKWHGKKAKEITLELSKGTLRATPAQLMTVYLYLKQEDSRACLMNENGGAVIGAFKAKAAKDAGDISTDGQTFGTAVKSFLKTLRTSSVFGVFSEQSKNPLVLTEADEARIIAALNEQAPGATEVADKLSKILNGKAAQLGNEVSMAMYGYKKYTTDNYFPMRVYETGKPIVLDPKTEMKRLDPSFTKERTHYSGKALIVEDVFDVVGRHLTGMAQYNAFAQLLDEATRMYTVRIKGGKSLKQTLIEQYGNEANDFYRNLLNNLSGAAIYSAVGSEALSERLLSNYKAAAVAKNLSVVFKQPMSIFRAMPEFTSAGWKAWHSIKDLSPTQVKAEMNEMLEHSGIAKLKNWGASENMTKKSFEELYNEPKKNLLQRFNDKLDSGAEFADMWTWSRLWRMSKAEIDATGKYAEGSSEYFEAVNRKFSEVIGRTQVVQSALDSSMAVQNAGQITKFLFAFQNEPLKQFSYLSSAINDVKRGKKGAKAKLAKVVGMSAVNTVFTSAISTLFSWLRGSLDRDDDDDIWDDLLSSFGENVISDILSGGLAPIWWAIEPVISAVESGAYGNEVERMDVAALTDLGGLINKYLIEQSGGRFNLGTVQDIINVASNLFGLSWKNAARDIKAVFDRVVLDTGIPPKVKYNYLKAWKDVELTDKSSVTKAYYEIVEDAVNRGRYEDYVYIKRDMIYHGYTETKIKNAVIKSKAMDELYELKKSNPGSYKAKVNGIVNEISEISELEGKEFKSFIESAMKKRENADDSDKTDKELKEEMYAELKKEIKERMVWLNDKQREKLVKELLDKYSQYGFTEADIEKIRQDLVKGK